jgi:hypothetical protein
MNVYIYVHQYSRRMETAPKGARFEDVFTARLKARPDTNLFLARRVLQSLG